MKSVRQEKILQLIEQNPIDRQEELLRLLHEEGFNVTQATISRDIKELFLVKAATGDGSYRYVSSLQHEKPYHTPNRFEIIFKQAAIKIDAAGNIVLVKCFSGMANAACEVFDSIVWNGVVGTLSGDDTFIIIARTEQDAQILKDQLQQYVATK